MNEPNVKHSAINGTSDYKNAGSEFIDHESLIKTENLLINNCGSPRLVIVEPVNSEDRSDESFHDECFGGNSKALTSDNRACTPVGLIKSESISSQAACNSSSSVKLPLGRYEISRVSKPQINLIATNLLSQVPKVDNSNVNFLNVSKPRSTPAREAVDPAKYYILNDEPDGTKYACSKCGNVYKWRKSLNKHWKEKHDGEAPPSLAEREKMLKCPPQNFQKHSGLHVSPVISAIGHKSPTISLTGYKAPSQIRIPSNSVNMYTIVNVHKPEPSSSRSPASSMHTSHSPNSIWKSQVFKKDDYKGRDLSAVYQNVSNLIKCKNSADSKLASDNSGVLDLSFKSSPTTGAAIDEQEEPIDFSTKAGSSVWNEAESTPSDLRVKVGLANNEISDFTCLQCHVKFSQMFDLNSHFACQHMNYLYEVADVNISSLDSKEHKSFTIQNFHNKGMEGSQCLVCGFSENWQWKMSKHFESEHFGIEPNPYKTSSINFSSAKNGSSSPTTVDSTATSVLSNKSMNAEILLKKLGIPDNGVLDFDSQGTAIVIPKAPEETAMYSKNSSYKSKTQDVAMFAEDGSSYLMTDAPEESSSSSETLRISFAGKSGRGKKENSSYNSDVVLPYECKLCGYRARWPSEMTQHMKNHSDEKPYQCPQCTYRSKWKWDVVKHLKRCGGSKDASENSQKRKRTFPKAFPEVSSSDAQTDSTSSCKSQPVESSLTQREVISRGPPNVTLYADDRPKKKCLEVAMSPLSEKGDMESVSNAIPSSSSDHHSNLYPCEQCYFVGHSPAELRRHMRVHSDEKPYSCNTCSYSSKWKCDLKKHLRTYNHVPAVPMNLEGGRKTTDAAENSQSGNASPLEEKVALNGENFLEGRLRCRECSYEAFNMMTFIDHVSKHGRNSEFVGVCGDGMETDEYSKDTSDGAPDNLKVKLLTSLGLHQMTSFGQQKLDSQDSSVVGNSEEEEEEEEDKIRFEVYPEKIKEEIVKDVCSRDESHYLKSASNPKHSFEESEENSALDCTTRTSGSVDGSKSTENASSDSKITPKLFTLQDLIVSDVRLKLIIKSGKHFYGCVKCPYVSSSSFRAVYHSRQHGSGKNFKCSFCDFASNQFSFVKDHVATLHGEENNNNNNSNNNNNNNNNFKRSTRLKTKKRKHFRIFSEMNLNLRRNVCISCGFASLNRASISKHRLTMPCFQLLIKHPISNLGSDIFSCNKCSFKTDEKLVLVNHSKGHDAPFQNKCSRCDFASPLSNVVSIHFRNQHTSSSGGPR